MQRTLRTLSDRALGLFLPKARAGACACGPWDGGFYQYRCYLGQFNQRRWCTYNCTCATVCGSWQDIGDC
jgi:hypothetical protein